MRPPTPVPYLEPFLLSFTFFNSFLRSSLPPFLPGGLPPRLLLLLLSIPFNRYERECQVVCGGGPKSVVIFRSQVCGMLRWGDRW